MNKGNRRFLKENCSSFKYSNNAMSNKATKILNLILIALVLFPIPQNILIYASEINKPVSTSVLTSERVAQIRNSKNTDISKRTGKVFYVSATGNDSNDGQSPESAWKTLQKIDTAFDRGIINEKDTILLNRGDEFRGSIRIKRNEILVGSYGNETLPKPEIIVSPYNGAIVGEWINVDTNIWKYTINGQNPFANDVGVVWFHSDDNELSNKMENVKGSFEYGKKITTNQNTDDSSLDIASILDEDLEFYHAGHAHFRNNSGKELYVYSKENPQERFDRIEFAIADQGIQIGGCTNTIIDNVTVKYAGIHGISAGTVANLKVTNSEFGYIGGATQSYGFHAEGVPVRYGNAVEIYGSVTDREGYAVEDGFVVQNNYVYQVYDAGITFQYTAEGEESKIENAIFDNNVVEYCNYSIEYWNKSTSSDAAIQENTYIKNYEITNNIMRYSGIGVSQTRPDKNQSAHIKTWDSYNPNDNIVKGKYIISNNIFDSSTEQIFWIYAGDSASLPTVTNNTFYNSYNVKFGYCYAHLKEYEIPYIQSKMEQVFPNNTYHYLEDNLDSYSGSGTIGEVKWDYDNTNGILSITGSGKMEDYTIETLPEWNKVRKFIRKIIIGENVTHIGNYAFYDLPYVEEIEINSKKLDDFSSSGINIGDNYAFYRTGSGWFGMDVTFGENVTVIPAYIFWPATHEYEAPRIKNVEFKGNKIKEIKNHAFLHLQDPIIVIPEGVEVIESLAFANTASTLAISVPDSVTRIDPWALAGNTKLEKIVFGKRTAKIGEYMLSGSHTLQEAIFTSDVEFTSNNYEGLFSKSSKDTTIFGNDSVKKLVSDYSTSTTTSNIKYQNSNEYKINITSNTDLLELSKNEYQAGENILFTVKDGYKVDSIDVYQKYQALDGSIYTISKVNISNLNNTYIIPGSYWDIDINATVSKIETEPEEDEDDTQDNNPETEDKPDDNKPNQEPEDKPDDNKPEQEPEDKPDDNKPEQGTEIKPENNNTENKVGATIIVTDTPDKNSIDAKNDSNNQSTSTDKNSNDSEEEVEEATNSNDESSLDIDDQESSSSKDNKNIGLIIFISICIVLVLCFAYYKINSKNK